MSFTSWLQNIRSALALGRGQRGRRGPHRAATHRLDLEVLEDRCLLSFSPVTSFPIGTNPQAVVTADFNGDGRLDLATANYGDNTVSVLLGNANGTFQPAVTSDTYGPLSLAVGDFNKDGNMDLATANDYDVSVMLGNGDGAFQAPTYIEIGSTDGTVVTSVAVGDFNGDGTMDLAVTSNVGVYYPGDAYPDSGRVSVLLAIGDGSFSTPWTTTSYWTTFDSAVVADFNGDGKADVVAADPVSGLSVLLGNGDGTLRYSYGISGNIRAVAVGDFTEDGIPDLVTAGYSTIVEYTVVDVWPGNGDGTFASVIRNPANSALTAVAAADFNGDGKLDIITANPGAGTVSVLLGLGDGTLTPPIDQAAGSYPDAVAVGDFNGDTRPDAAAADYGLNAVSVLLNDGDWLDLNAPRLQISDVTVTEGNTGTVTAVFTVTLSFASDQPVTVAYATGDGAATAGSDYQTASATVTFNPGETSKTITVLVNGDRLGEGNETFFVNLSQATDGFISDGQGVGTIVDDEPRVSIGDVTALEGNTGTTAFAFRVSLSAAYDLPVTVGYATANGTATAGSDYQAASGTLTIPAGQTSGTITVLVNGDRLVEPNEIFGVNLSAPTNAAIGDEWGIGNILDNEPRISVSDVTRAEGTTKGNSKKTTSFTFIVTLSAAYDQAVTMSYRTVDGTATTSDSDYVAKSGTLTFAPGETTKTITIEVNGDSKKEADETFYLDLFGNSGNSLFTKNRGIGTILNDDN